MNHLYTARENKEAPHTQVWRAEGRDERVVDDFNCLFHFRHKGKVHLADVIVNERKRGLAAIHT